MNKVIITQSNYIPWKGYFSYMREATHLVLYDDMQYTKRDWRNRNKLISSDGPKWLSIPIDVKGKFHQKINEAQVSDESWGEKHWNFIKNNYGKAKYFFEYEKHFKNLFLENTSSYLSDINLGFIKKIIELLNIEITILSSKEFDLKGNRTEKLVNICTDLCASKYFTAPAAKNYIEESLFSIRNIEIEYYNYDGFIKYKQNWDGFSHEVSILDMFFNLGPDTINYFN